MFFLETLFQRFGYVTNKYSIEILCLWYICPIFFVLKIVSNMAFDEEFVLSSFMTQ